MVQTTSSGPVKRKQNEHWGIFLATYAPLPLAVPMCRALGSDTQALTKAMAVRRVYLQGDISPDQAHAAAGGRETAHLYRHFSLMLQHTLSRRTCRYQCWQGIVHVEATRLPSEPEAMEAHPDRRSSFEPGTMTGGMKMGEPQCKCERMTSSAAPSGSSNIDDERPSVVGMEDAASEDE